MSTYYLLIGSNIGDRNKNCQIAIEKIADKIGHVVNISRTYLTEPWGVKDQDHFINQALIVDSPLKPNEVLQHINNIESNLNTSKKEQWGPRVIDIDILYCDDLVINSTDITIPHPRIYERNFVLVPLMEIAPDFIDPVKKVSIEDLFDICEDNNDVFIEEEEE